MDNKYDVSVKYNIYKQMSEKDINRNQFLYAETEEAYNQTGENTCADLIAAYENLTKSEWHNKINTVVDFGCGDLRIARFMSAECKVIIGLDINPFVLEEAHKKIAEYGISNCLLAMVDDFKVGNAADFLYCFQVLQHNTYEEQIEIIKKIRALLKPEAYACIHLPKIESKPGYVNIDTCMCFTRENVEEIGSYFSWYEIRENLLLEGWEDYFLWVKI